MCDTYANAYDIFEKPFLSYTWKKILPGILCAGVQHNGDGTATG